MNETVDRFVDAMLWIARAMRNYSRAAARASTHTSEFAGFCRGMHEMHQLYRSRPGGRRARRIRARRRRILTACGWPTDGLLTSAP